MSAHAASQRFGSQRVWGGVRRVAASQESGLLTANAVLIFVLALVAPLFFTGSNFRSTALLAAYTGVMAAFATPVLISGGLDLSIGAVAVLTGQIAAIALTHGWSTPAAVTAALVAGAGIGALNALFVVGLGINALVATIGTGFVFVGVAGAWTNGLSTPVDDQSLLNLGASIWYGIPEATYFMLAAFAVVWLVLWFTRLGSNLYAVGSNAVAARRAGIRVWLVQSTVYVFSGASAAFAGLILIGYQGSSIPTAAAGIQFTVLGAVVLGGTGLEGGSGSVLGTLLGVSLLAAVNSGIVALSVDSYWQLIATGVALALAIAIDDVRRRRRATRG